MRIFWRCLAHCLVTYQGTIWYQNELILGKSLCPPSSTVWQDVPAGNVPNAQIHAKIIPTDTPLFDVEHVSVSNTGRWICLWGSRGVTAMEVPRRGGKQRQFIGIDADGNVVTHTVPIAERFFLSNSKIVVQQV